MRILIVDDEPLARERIRAILARESDCEILGEAGNGAEAIELIRREKPDLVFLDIQMPGTDGFGVLRELKGDMPAVIFVTAFDEYAVKAFEVHALDYLLKPFKPARLREAVHRARERLAQNTGAHGQDDITRRVLALLEEREKQPAWLSRIAVRTGNRVLFLKVGDVDWIEASGNYVVIHSGTARHMMRETLGEMERKLPPAKFHRVNRSAIVNLERVAEIQPLFNNEHVVILSTGAKINLARSLREIQDKLKYL